MDSRCEIEAIKDVLRQHGLHSTTARVAVLHCLRGGHAHLPVDELRTEVLARYPTIDPATIYRTLETLEARGLVVRVTLGDKVTRWAYITDAHHHLVCRHCGRVVEVGDEPFRRLVDELAREHGLHVDLRHMVLHGLCSICSTDG